MRIQFSGMIGHRLASEIIPSPGPVFDNDYNTPFVHTS